MVAGIPGSNTTAEESTVSDSVEYLERTVSKLEASVGELINHLAPVLCSHDEPGCVPDPSPCDGSPLRLDVEGLNNRVQAVIRTIAETRDRLDLPREECKAQDSNLRREPS